MNTQEKPARNPSEVIDKMVEALGNEYPQAVVEFTRIKRDSAFRAPEMQRPTWAEMQEVLHDIVLRGTAKADLSETQKAVIRIFTDNRDIV